MSFFFTTSFVINVLAKRWKLQIEFGKISFGIASVSNIIMMMGMKTYDKLWWIALGFSGFGFRGAYWQIFLAALFYPADIQFFVKVQPFYL